MPAKSPPKHCHECVYFLPPEPASGDPSCRHAAETKALEGYPILQTTKFQRSSGFVTDCGPGGMFWEARP